MTFDHCDYYQSVNVGLCSSTEISQQLMIKSHFKLMANWQGETLSPEKHKKYSIRFYDLHCGPY